MDSHNNIEAMGNQNASIERMRLAVQIQRNAKVKFHLARLKELHSQLKITQSLEERILRAPVYQLVAMLNKGQANSKQLVVVFGIRSTTVGMDYKLITEENIQEAIALAEKCDEIRINSGKLNWTLDNADTQETDSFLPPLFGIPLSVKDCFDMKGKMTTMGITARSHFIKEKDCGLVACLKEAGMIPFVRSNLSQVMMIFESNNFLWGRAKNIWNRTRTVGGSSGGQAGLIAAQCSPMGIGTDVGGSVRIPAQFCGIYSLKPCEKRFSNSIFYSSEISQTFTGKDTIPFVYGPLGKSVDDLALWMKTALTEKYHTDPDPYIKLLPFNTSTYLSHQKRTLKIGYFRSHQVLETTPASQRAILEVVASLKQLGHEVVEIELPNFVDIFQAFFAEGACEGNFNSFDEILEKQDSIPQYAKMKVIAKLPSLVRTVVKALAEKMYPRLAIFLKHSGKMSVEEYLKHVGSVQYYRKAVYEMWRSSKLDHIISPGFGCQAALHGLSQDIPTAAIYTIIWNVLGYTAGAMPITVVGAEQQQYVTRHNDMISTALRRNAEGSEGLPVGIQVVGLPYEEEKVLALMKVIDEQFRFPSKHQPPAAALPA